MEFVGVLVSQAVLFLLGTVSLGLIGVVIGDWLRHKVQPGHLFPAFFFLLAMIATESSLLGFPWISVFLFGSAFGVVLQDTVSKLTQREVGKRKRKERNDFYNVDRLSDASESETRPASTPASFASILETDQ